jgi:hypothetical protein
MKTGEESSDNYEQQASGLFCWSLLDMGSWG